MKMSPNLWINDPESTVGNSGEEGVREWVWEDKDEFSVSTTCWWDNHLGMFRLVGTWRAPVYRHF